MTEPTKAVFLSYASEDAEAARGICDALRAAGVEVWFDQSELRGGDAWDRQIRKQIHDCALFMPIISLHSQERLEGYFRLEWKLAVDRSHLMAAEKPFLVPVVIDDISERNASVPDKFRDVQWTHLPAGKTPAAFVERVSGLVSSETARAPAEMRSPLSAALPTGTTSRQPAPTSPVSRRTQRVLLVIAAVAIGGGYFAIDKFVLSNRGAGTGQPSAQSAQGAPMRSALQEKSIAVLPFVDLSEKHDQEYFADGMAEEIINLLVKIPDLKVIGRTSSFQFKGKADDLRKIGTALGAAYVVEGSVRRSGDHIRVTAQLIDTRDGTHRWSETYNRDVSDALKVQDEIATSLVRALQVEVISSTHLQGRPLPKNDEAYDSYLRGLHALDQWDQSHLEEGIADFQHALELDPSFAPAAAWRASALYTLTGVGYVLPEAGFERARAAAEAALKLDPKSALAHATLGDLDAEDRNWAGAARELQTAMMLAPNDPEVLDDAAQPLLILGDWNQALRLLDAASTADPLNTGVLSAKAWGYVGLGRLAEAEATVRHSLEIDPTGEFAHGQLGMILLAEGKAEETLVEVRKEPNERTRLAGLAVVYQALHRPKDSDVALSRLEAEHGADMGMAIAEVYAFRGQKDKAFRWLDRAFAQKDVNLDYIKSDFLLKNLRGDPRYEAFLRKMNLPD